MPDNLTAAVRHKMDADPDIAEAIAEGYTLADIATPGESYRNLGERVADAQYRHGPHSPEVDAAIVEANRVSVMLTSARAAYMRILRETW